MSTDLHKANNLRQVCGELGVQWFSLVWSRNAETFEETVVLEYLHVSGSEVAKVLPDQVQLVHV